jgi:hypothetical protein
VNELSKVIGIYSQKYFNEYESLLPLIVKKNSNMKLFNHNYE